MLLNHTPDDIINNWQHLSDRALEAGQPLLLIIGASDGNVDTLSGLYAYEVFNARRPAGRPPLLLTGGAGSAWLLALLQIPSANQQDRSLRPRNSGVAYIGATPGTAMAATAIYDAASVSPARRRLMPIPGEIPIGLQEQILPLSRPAQPVRWSAFPLALAAETQHNPPIGIQSRDTARIEPNWSAGAAIVLAVALVVLAVLL